MNSHYYKLGVCVCVEGAGAGTGQLDDMETAQQWRPAERLLGLRIHSVWHPSVLLALTVRVLFSAGAKEALVSNVH